ncbi:solute carrier family 25 member 38 [Obba rivulosa]|uniref:Mitochondrial glycine transporter n=1 Tax=Obba rivulosa TaxID=1052685 RepID=A0A8E2AM14_9APHY|nr:solute carrier family 25 member 38 [Obba rivulosa]
MSNASQHLVSGALSGFVSTVCLQPLDLLKTRIQQGEDKRRQHVILKTAYGVVHKNGFRALWRGTTATLLRNIPGVALYFTGLNHVRSILANSPYFAAVRAPSSGLPQTHRGSVLPRLTNQGNLLAGVTTRVVVGAALNPFAVLKARYESNLYSYSNIFDAIRSLSRAGRSELFRGVLASSLRDAPYAGLFVVVYERMKVEMNSLFIPMSPTHHMIIHAHSAIWASTIATLATQPFDVVKTKMQVRQEDKYHSLVKTIASIWHQRGARGFFDGAALRIMRKPLSSAIGWAVYEGVLMAMHTQPHPSSA